MNTLAKLIITGLGTGYLRPAPGTWGSAAIIAIYLAAVALAGGDATAVNLVLAAALVLSSIGCIAFGPAAEKLFGKKDPSHCVIDEWAGQSLTLLLLPVVPGAMGLAATAAAAFLSFRFFDIVKPPPARQMEKLPYGWGVLLDDLMAGVYANITCQVLLRLVLPWMGILK